MACSNQAHTHTYILPTYLHTHINLFKYIYIYIYITTSTHTHTYIYIAYREPQAAPKYNTQNLGASPHLSPCRLQRQVPSSSQQRAQRQPEHRLALKAPRRVGELIGGSIYSNSCPRRCRKVYLSRILLILRTYFNLFQAY